MKITHKSRRKIQVTQKKNVQNISTDPLENSKFQKSITIFKIVTSLVIMKTKIHTTMNTTKYTPIR